MTTVQPPPIAARLLKRLVPAQNHEALLGDLCEEYQRRRSRAWYWLQILAAVAFGTWKDVRAHRLLTLRAIGVGIISLVAAVLALFSIFAVVDNVFVRYLQSGVLIGGHWFRVYWPTAEAARVLVDGHLFRVPYLSIHRWMRFTLYINLLSFYIGFLVSGWVIGRLNRDHGITFVAAFAAFVGSLFLALYAYTLVALALHVFGHIHAPGVREVAADSSHDTYVSPLWMVLCIVIGGYFATRRAEAK